MRVLLNTSCLYDFIDRPGTLSDTERRFSACARDRVLCDHCLDPGNAVKDNARRTSGERRGRLSPEDALTVMENQDVTILSMTECHATCRLKIPPDHKDPFAGLLRVQAQADSLRFLTVDRRLAGHLLLVPVHQLEHANSFHGAQVNAGHAGARHWRTLPEVYRPRGPDDLRHVKGFGNFGRPRDPASRQAGLTLESAREPHTLGRLEKRVSGRRENRPIRLRATGNRSFRNLFRFTYSTVHRGIARLSARIPGTGLVVLLPGSRCLSA